MLPQAAVATGVAGLVPFVQTGAFLVHAGMALFVAGGRLALPPKLAIIVLAALASAAASGVFALSGNVVLKNYAAYAEVVLWVLFLAVHGRVLAEAPGRAALATAAVLSATVPFVAPTASCLMARGAVSIIGLFLVAAPEARRSSDAVPGYRLALLLLGCGFAFDVLAAGLTLVMPEAGPLADAVRPLLRALMLLFVLHGLAGIAQVPAELAPAPLPSHDYRVIWPAFVEALSGARRRNGAGDNLPERVIQAVADMVGVRQGAIWLTDGADHYRRLALLGMPMAGSGTGLAPGLASALLCADGPLSLNDRLLARVAWPEFLPGRDDAWLMLPLVHREALLGFMLLARPFHLDGEDRELLRLLGRQAGSYLAEDEVSRALATARQYESFTRRFAYIAHDLKNIASRLTLMLANARRHRDDPAFYDDMLVALDSSVERMNRLISQLRREPGLESVALASLLRGLADRRADSRIVLGEPLAAVTARAEAAALEAALEHLLDNALQALDEHGRVTLGLEQQGSMAVITIADDGPGLPPEISRGLDRRQAFASRKPGGLGLGLDQARHTVERAGGRFSFVSQPGKGTTIVLHLPCPASSDRGHAGQGSSGPGLREQPT